MKYMYIFNMIFIFFPLFFILYFIVFDIDRGKKKKKRRDISELPMAFLPFLFPDFESVTIR